jgi:lycopene beta-cyclase
MELLLAGGGLANSLIAYRLAAALPALRVRLFEAGPTLGGNHTWSFHGVDLDCHQRHWLAPLVVHDWEHSDVRFPGLERRLPVSYHSITSERLHAVVAPRLGPNLSLNTSVMELEPGGIRLASGESIRADLLIDGRGPGEFTGLDLGWQKFLGQELVLDRPHGLEGPLLMDATVAQADGYCFLYLLPFGPDRVLVEDTCYSDDPSLDRPALEKRIGDYVADRGWTVTSVARTEAGVLPIVLDGDPGRFWPASDRVARSGLRAGVFHPTTGYSLPAAVALADELAAFLDRPGVTGDDLVRHLRARFLDHWRRQAYFRLLNRLLFRAAKPAERWRVLRHFYRLPHDTIARFYAGRITPADRLRILSGRPPVPVFRALGVLLGARPAPRTGAPSP